MFTSAIPNRHRGGTSYRLELPTDLKANLGVEYVAEEVKITSSSKAFHTVRRGRKCSTVNEETVKSVESVELVKPVEVDLITLWRRSDEESTSSQIMAIAISLRNAPLINILSPRLSCFEE